MRFFSRIAAISLVLLATACSSSGRPDKFGAHPVSFHQLSGWNYDNHIAALAAFKKSCPILSKKSRGRSKGSGLNVDTSTWRSLCKDAMSVPAHNNALAHAFFERRFVPYRVTNHDNERGLFTGYYEPLLYGSLRKKGNFQWPLYKPPPGLKHKKPYYTQAQINRGAITRRGLELVWLDDPVMRFFLMIQGSGRVQLEDGRELYVGYADQNGHGYVSIGKVMADEGLMPREDINFFTLRKWLYDHRYRAFDIMERNPSYVFFKLRDKPGPIGSIGAVLTPQRSLAVDSRHIPYGLPLFLQTELPAQPGYGATPFNHLMIAQDTGGAIRGPVRGDIFFGNGHEAEYFAGYMKGRGQYTLLVPKEIEYQLQ